MQKHDIIVMGASAGGVETLPKALQGLPNKFPAALFVVLHLPAGAQSHLPDIIKRASLLNAVHPKDKERVQKGKIYVAPPDHHLWLENGHVRVTRGPRINGHRPAVDPLFQTAAERYGPRVVGVILTGALDDGTTGLHTVKKCGGVAVVQKPEDAAVRSMPESALHHVEVDHCLPLDKIGPLLIRLAGEKVKPQKGKCEQSLRFSMNAMTPAEMEAQCGAPSSF